MNQEIVRFWLLWACLVGTVALLIAAIVNTKRFQGTTAVLLGVAIQNAGWVMQLYGFEPLPFVIIALLIIFVGAYYSMKCNSGTTGPTASG